MTRDQAVARIKQGLGFRTDKTMEIEAMLREAQRDLERGKTLPKFLLRTAQSLTLLVNTRTVALPSDFLRRDERIYYTDIPTGPKPIYIAWKSFEEGLAAYAEDQSAGPQVATLRNSDIYFFPAPDKTYNLQWSYYKKAAVLNSNIENEWLDEDGRNAVPELLIGEAGHRMAMDLQDDRAIAIFERMRTKAADSMLRDVYADDDGDGPLVMGANN